jgi:hypothetical protein
MSYFSALLLALHSELYQILRELRYNIRAELKIVFELKLFLGINRGFHGFVIKVVAHVIL